METICLHPPGKLVLASTVFVNLKARDFFLTYGYCFIYKCPYRGNYSPELYARHHFC